MVQAPIGFMNHFTMSTPDIDAVSAFWVDFLGAEEYSSSKRLVQYLVGGILVDCFPPADVSKMEELPQPGSEAQYFRFSIQPSSVNEWIDRANEWKVPTRLSTDEDLLGLML